MIIILSNGSWHFGTNKAKPADPFLPFFFPRDTLTFLCNLEVLKAQVTLDLLGAYSFHG